MTLKEWARETVERFSDLPPHRAAAASANSLRMGAQWRAMSRFGSPIWETGDWDVLLVFDACRLDTWDAVGAGRLEGFDSGSTWSNASCSIDWIERNFNKYPDEAARTAYVTANPFADHDDPSVRSADLSDAGLGLFAPLYKTHWQEVGDGIATVPPGPVTEHAIAAWRRRREIGFERMVVHYMQPHEPYRSRPDWGSSDHRLLENLVDEDAEAGSSVWPRVRRGEVGVDELVEACEDNLEWVLDDVTARLLENIDARVAITSDHGNAMGEWGEWHHPPGAMSPAVRRVPWVTGDGIDAGTCNPDVDLSRFDGAIDAREKLKALGYL